LDWRFRLFCDLRSRRSTAIRKQIQSAKRLPCRNVKGPGMTARDDKIRIRPGHIRPGHRGAQRPGSFVGEVMRAAKKAGHIGKGFSRTGASNSRSTFGRGRRAALALSSRSSARRVVIMTRVVRHRGRQFVAAPLAKHVAYLKREGVTRDGEEVRLFDAASDNADGKAFAERCAEDRHHFRFIVSPEDAVQMADLRAFTGELMKDVERDLGTKLEWVAVDHWNTDNPHIHVLVRGIADDGRDLIISRDYISEGFRQRAAERVALELGPRTEKEIQDGLRNEAEAERWTSLDQALRNIADEHARFVDLRPGATVEDQELRGLLIGRAAKLERLGLADTLGPAQWSLKSGLEPALREMAPAATSSRPSITLWPAQAASPTSAASPCMAWSLQLRSSDGWSNAVFKTSSKGQPMQSLRASAVGPITCGSRTSS
jgi:type IV secretory pathway VirD2 relaxase